MHWYGTISFLAEGKAGDLRKLPRMARAYEEAMRRDGEPSDCVYEAGYFAQQLEDAVLNLGEKADNEITKIKVTEDCDTAHVPVLMMHAIADVLMLSTRLCCAILSMGSMVRSRI